MMRRLCILLCHTLLASFCHIANAEESWLLLSHPTGEDTVKPRLRVNPTENTLRSGP
jgi:hypothetical protein